MAAQRVERAAADAAAHAADDEAGVEQFAGIDVRGVSMEQKHAEIGRDGVEPTGMHDARAGRLRRSVRSVDGPAHEQRLAGEVRIMRAGRRARLHEREPVPQVRPDRRRDHVGRARQSGQRLVVLAVGDEHRPLRRAGQAVADLRQLRHRPTRKRDARVVRCVPGEVVGDESPDEAARAVQHDVVLAFGCTHDRKNVPQRLTGNSALCSSYLSD